MITKEKAKAIELLHKFLPWSRDWDIKRYATYNAKECVYVMIDGIIEEFKGTHIGKGAKEVNGMRSYKIEFWNNVKKEVKKLPE